MSTLKLDTIASRDGTESTDVTNVINGSAKAWVNFNGIGTVAIRESFNVASITDNGTGDYTVNFTNAMVDANYCFSGGAGVNSSDLMCVVQPQNTYSPTTTSCRFQVIYNANTFYDVSTVNVVIFR